MNSDVEVRNSDIEISIETTEMKCTENTCIDDKDINKLQCGQCKRKVHYKCSRLPAYQLQRYLVASLGQYYSKFLCSNCVNVPDSILKELIISDNVISLENEITMQKAKIESYEKELNELRNLVALQQDTEKVSSKKRKLGERSISNEEIELHEEDLESNNIINNDKQTIQDLSRMFESRFEKIEMKMIEMIQQNLPNKQENNLNTVPSYSQVVNTSNPVNTDFRNLIIAAKNEERVEEKDKKLRENNIIVHGRDEKENNEENDKSFINDMLKEISVGAITTKSIARIGRNDNGKSRPIKVTFKTVDDRNKVMSNLKYLKGKDAYNKISVTEDLTLSERKMIKDYVEKAKQQNKELGANAKTIVVVRGSPKNGLYLKEVMKEKRPLPQMEVAQTSSQ